MWTPADNKNVAVWKKYIYEIGVLKWKWVSEKLVSGKMC